MYLSEEVVEKFWTKVDKRTSCECWPWIGRIRNGYGVIDLPRKLKGRRNARAHRISLAIFMGIDLEDLSGDVRHICDNPPCVNPAHLLEGTHTENMQDKVRRGRHVVIPCQGSLNGYAILDEADVKEIKGRLKRGETNVSIAFNYGVHHSTISAIKLGKLWNY